MNREDIGRLPPMERDILHLHLVLKKTQTTVARILGVSQPTVNYRYARARERLDFLDKLPQVTAEEVRRVLRELGARNTDVEAMALYIETNSQSEVARRMDASQGAVRHWLHRALVNHLQTDMRTDDLHQRVRRACQLLVSKPGILNENREMSTKVVSLHVARPKFRGALAAGSTVVFLGGLYQGMQGQVTLLSRDEVSVMLRLESQRITLTWAR